MEDTHVAVQEYYGKVLKKTGDLQTNACCTGQRAPAHIARLIANVHPEVTARYYGCGLVAPDELKGLKILDLGCGAGRDCYVLSQLVGKDGWVCGVDMTKEQLDVANAHKAYHAEKFGFANVEFRQGFIEDLHAAGLQDNTFDVIVSNCVVNLSPNKEAVLREAHRVLKEGGELYFSDVYADRRVPKHVTDDPMLFGECLGGAFYWGDFLRLARQVGFPDPRLVTDSRIALANAKVEALVGAVEFFSATFRLFKIPGLETECEDYGQAVAYRGTVPLHPLAFSLDAHHTMETGRVFPVCRNTHLILRHSRFQSHFEFFGTDAVHYGVFKGCGGGIPFASVRQEKPANKGTSSCCC